MSAGAEEPGGIGDALVLVDHGTRWLRLRRPAAILEAHQPSDVVPVLREVEAWATERAGHAVGFVAYEAGCAWGLAAHAPGPLPLAVFALYEAGAAEPALAPSGAPLYEVGRPQPSWSEEAYTAAFAQVRHHLAEGDTYQVNGTFQLHAPFTGPSLGLFANLVATQRGRYAAWLRLPGCSLCSASPELFFARTGCRIVARPMKGSAPRGRSHADDRAIAARLRASEKDRAENVMVVDMVRNDLGRVARTGTVHARRLFAIERYPTIWQMTSEVAAETTAPLDEIFAAMFPSASITGAPKARTMAIIKAMEPGPRGVYTGAIGYVAPGGAAQFNVAIRTAVVHDADRRLAFGVGSGIVWDSEPQAEYRECLLKGLVLGRRHQPFDLLETLAWSPGDGFVLLEEHLARLQASAAYFGRPLRRTQVRRVLDDAVAGEAGPRRVRLLVAEDGRPRAEISALTEVPAVVEACLATGPIDERDAFLFHKTTRREAYERHRCDRCEDVVLWNTRGEITESIVANVVVEVGGELVTPPVSSGLLAGTARERALRDGRIREGVITVEALHGATAAWLVNSVRGWRALRLVSHDLPPAAPAP